MCIGSPGRPTRCSPSSFLFVCLPYQAEKKTSYLLYVCCRRPELTPFLNSMHNHIFTQAFMDTHTLSYTHWEKHVKWTEENLSRPTGTRCPKLLRLMFCVDLHWKWMRNNGKVRYPVRKHHCSCLMSAMVTNKGDRSGDIIFKGSSVVGVYWAAAFTISLKTEVLNELLSDLK